MRRKTKSKLALVEFRLCKKAKLYYSTTTLNGIKQQRKWLKKHFFPKEPAA